MVGDSNSFLVSFSGIQIAQLHKPTCMQIINKIFRKTLSGRDALKNLYEINSYSGSQKLYLIHKTGGGMFSILSSVLCHLDIAEKCGFTPVVIFDDLEATYSDGEIFGTKNSWEYYFQPIGENFAGNRYLDVQSIVIPKNYYPMGYNQSITKELHLHGVYSRWVKLRPELNLEIDSYKSSILQNSRVLGVHFRGQEMRTASGHWFPPTTRQMQTAIDFSLEKYGYDKIFIVTEEAGYLDFLKKRYGNLVCHSNAYRTYGKNAYKEYPRDNHKYLLGKEVIIDATLLASCSGLIACTSNVSEYARFINNGRYIQDLQINNGPNSRVRYLAKYLWFIRASLPHGIGGFLRTLLQRFMLILVHKNNSPVI